MANLTKEAAEAPTERTLQRMKEVVDEFMKIYPDITLDADEAASLEIQQEQRGVGLVFNKRAFSLLCKQISSEFKTNIKWDIAAFEVKAPPPTS